MDAVITWTLNNIHAPESPAGADDKNIRVLQYTVRVEKDEYALVEQRVFNVEGSSSDISYFDELSEN